jgi:enoyl-CoA hydratase/carnithine racemase
MYFDMLENLTLPRLIFRGDGKSFGRRRQIKRDCRVCLCFAYCRVTFNDTILPYLAHRDQGGTISIAILRCRKITIAAVNGHAVRLSRFLMDAVLLSFVKAGVGVTALQLPFDFRFVWAGAKLAFPFVRRGIAPEGIYRHAT